jgi:hypothetical protein
VLGVISNVCTRVSIPDVCESEKTEIYLGFRIAYSALRTSAASMDAACALLIPCRRRFAIHQPVAVTIGLKSVDIVVGVAAKPFRPLQ